MMLSQHSCQACPSLMCWLTIAVAYECRRIGKQSHVEGGQIMVAGNLDYSSVLPDNIMRYPQAQAGAGFPRREERLKNVRQILFAYPSAVIANLNRDGRSQRWPLSRGPNRDLALLLNCLLSI